MADNYVNLPAGAAVSWKTSVANLAALPASGNTTGDARVALDTGAVYVWTGAAWVNVAGSGGVTSVAAVGAVPNANAASISGTTLTLQPSDATNPGVLTTGTQTIAGAKTLTGNTLIANNAGSQATIGGASSTAVHVVSGGLTQTVRSISSNLTIDTTTKDNIIFADTSGGAFNLTLPPPGAGRSFKLIDTTNSFSTNNLTIVRNGSEKINNVAASKVLSGGGLIWSIITDGTNWWVG